MTKQIDAAGRLERPLADTLRLLQGEEFAGVFGLVDFAGLLPSLSSESSTSGSQFSSPGPRFTVVGESVPGGREPDRGIPGPGTQVWQARSGAAVMGLVSAFRRSGGIAAIPGRRQVVVHVGNLTRSQGSALEAIAAGDETGISALNAIFALARWDDDRQELLLATDRYGDLPLYFSSVGNRVCFGSQAKTILALLSQPASLNRQVLTELLMFQCPLGEESLFSGIEKVPPGSVLTFTQGRRDVRRYWTLRFHPAPEAARGEVLRSAENEFSRTVTGACERGNRVGLALSGGLDTRAMLAEVMGQQRTLATFTSGVAGSADMRAARRMSHFTRGPHYELTIGHEFLEQFEEHLQSLVQFGEGLVPAQDAHLMPQVRTTPRWFDVLLDGVYAEVVKRGPLHWARHGLGILDHEAVTPFLMRHWGSAVLADLVFDETEGRTLKQRAEEKLRSAVEDTRQDHTHDTIDAFLLRTVWPNRYGPQLALQDRFIEGQLPFMDYQFMDEAARLAAPWRDKAMFQFFVVADRAPILKQYGRVFADFNGPWSDNMVAKYALPGLNRVLTRFGFPGLDRPNYPYRIWWRRELNSALRRALQALDERRIFRAGSVSRILLPDSVPSVLFDRAAGVLWMLEVWHRHFQ